MNRFILVLISALFLSGPVWPQNLIVNGDFQAGDTGFLSEYTPSDNLGAAGVYVITADPGPLNGNATSYFDHTFGDEGGLMMAVNGGTEVSEIVWLQSVPVETNRMYTFQMWISSWYVELQAELVVQINGEPLGDSFFAPDSTAVWQLHEWGWSSGLATTATIEIINLSTVSAPLASGNDFALDDISFIAGADTNTVGGSVTGFTPDFVLCRNLTTRQTVRITPTGDGEFDCEAEGLDVDSGDGILLLIRGVAD